DADGVVAHRGDDARDVRAVAVVVEGVVRIVDEIPPNEIVNILVAIVGNPIGPAALANRLEDISSGDAAIAVEVGDLARPLVDRIVEVAERDEPIAIDIDQASLDGGGNLTLVDPDVLIEVGVPVVDARIDDGDDVLRAAGGDIPGFRRVEVGVHLAARLSGVVQGVLRSETGIAGDDRHFGEGRATGECGGSGNLAQPARMGEVAFLELPHLKPGTQRTALLLMTHGD